MPNLRTYESCARDMSVTLGVSLSDAAVDALVLWQVAETGLDPHHLGARFNTCNTTLVTEGATLYNSAGVKNYATYHEGLAAWYQTIMLHYYADIRDTMQNASLEEILTAIEKSPWGTFHIPRTLTDYMQNFAPLNLRSRG